jgi:hypothetical protein
MIPSSNTARYAHHRLSDVQRDGVMKRIAIGIAAVLTLIVIGDKAATAFDSPLLAVVVAGMLFLTGVAVHGAVGAGRR